MNPVRVLKNAFINLSNSAQLLAEIREGVANMTDVIDRRMKHLSGTVAALESMRGEARMPDRSRALAARPPVKAAPANDLARFVNIFDGLTPWAGIPGRGKIVNAFGVLTDRRFLHFFLDQTKAEGESWVETRFPRLEDGELWFEMADWVEAARDARERFVMITLGACFGFQAVGSYRALQMINPVPCKLVAVEPEPENCRWIEAHFRDNGLDPNDHWIVRAAISDTNAPVLFPVGMAGSGAQNCYATNEAAARSHYVDTLLARGDAADALRNLLIRNTTGIEKQLLPGMDEKAEIKLVSAVTLEDVLNPFDRVDFLEVDMQQSEIVVFPPFMDLVKRKVRRVHLGTHGKDVHAELAALFRRDGWEIVFDYAPNTDYETPQGKFSLNDGVLTAVNPDLA